MLDKLRAGELVCVSSADAVPNRVDRSSLLRFDMKSTVALPLSVAQRLVGVVTFAATRRERQWSVATVRRVRLAASMFASVLARRQSDDALRLALGEVKRLSDQLRAENVYLRREVASTRWTSAIVGQSAGRSAALSELGIGNQEFGIQFLPPGFRAHSVIRGTRTPIAERLTPRRSSTTLIITET